MLDTKQIVGTVSKRLTFLLTGGKRQCFERVKQKFPNCQLLSVGDGSEEEAVSKQVREVSAAACTPSIGFNTVLQQMNIPFARVGNVDDLKRLKLS